MTDLGFEYAAHILISRARNESDDFVLYDHDLLLIGVRGERLLPNKANRPASFKKNVFEVIEQMYADVPRLGLFARSELHRPGWTTWENGAPERTVQPDRPEIDESEIDLD